jgi:hypothetical protein
MAIDDLISWTVQHELERNWLSITGDLKEWFYKTESDSLSDIAPEDA